MPYYEYENEMSLVRELAKSGDIQGLMKNYDEFEDLPVAQPDDNMFCFPNMDDIVDKSQSAAWNVEACMMLRNAYAVEQNRLRKEYRTICDAYEESIVELLGKESGISLSEAKIVWEKANDDCGDGGVYSVCDKFSDLADFVSKVIAVHDNEIEACKCGPIDENCNEDDYYQEER